MFLDKIPKSAAVNECVNLCKKYGYKSACFVNAILRKVVKGDYEELKNIGDDFERISKMYSMPEWIVRKLINEYGMQKAEEICKNSNLRPKVTVRINTLKTTVQELQDMLDERNIQYEVLKIPNFLHLKNIKNVSNLDLFKEGYFTVQDEGAGKIGIVLNPKLGENVLDACSAPGGKTTHLAEIMNNEGNIEAWDIHKHRIKLVEENAKRLGINIIKTEVKNALEYTEKYEKKFDKILLDVPCMGIGVLKRKPDIKWQKEQKDIPEIIDVQKNILRTCLRYLKIGGELVYSTCSILKEENEMVVEVNGKEKCFEVLKQETILPDINTDGFFICKIKRIM